MTDIDPKALEEAARRIVEDNRKARTKGREQAQRLIEALQNPEADLGAVVEEILDDAVGSVAQPEDDDESEDASSS